MIKQLAILSALAVSSCSPSFAEDRPKDPHIGYTVMAGTNNTEFGEFWDKADCEFVGKGIKDAVIREIFRPYDTTPGQALQWMTIEVVCVRKAL